MPIISTQVARRPMRFSIVMPSTPSRTIDYWAESRRPFASLIFLLPLLAIYEFGSRLSEGEQVAAVRNGADTWMRIWLLQAGVDRPWVLPVLIIGILLGWHLVRNYSWRVSVETLIGMLSESLLGAILLLVLGQVLSLAFGRLGLTPAAAAVDAAIPSQAATAIGFLGAGIYEEVLFRLLLLPAVYCGLRALLLPSRWAAVTAVVSTSVVFSLAHYVEPGGSLWPSFSAFSAAGQLVANTPTTWFGCGFRILAGLVFALLFLVRGFGITVGCHVLYDLLVGMLIAPEA